MIISTADGSELGKNKVKSSDYSYLSASQRINQKRNSHIIDKVQRSSVLPHSNKINTARNTGR